MQTTNLCTSGENTQFKLRLHFLFIIIDKVLTFNFYCNITMIYFVSIIFYFKK